MEKNLEIQIFKNEQFGQVRIAMSESNEPMFCLADVCQVLDLTPSKVAQRLDEGVLSKYPLETAGGIQQANFVNEDGLYDTILDSRKPEAKQFRKWVTSEVLPSIRKHGMYATDITIENMIANPDFAIQLLINLKEEKTKRVEAEQKIEADKPKVLFAESLKASNRSILIGELAKILNQNGYLTGQKRLFNWLRENGYLMKTGSQKNQPTQYSMELGLFEVTKGTVVRPDDVVLTTITTKVTVKGQEYFINKFIGEKEVA